MPEDPLQLPAGRVARDLVRGYLADACAARRRLEDPADLEALHDFRVALRRLRSTERAYRGQLEAAMGKKLRKRIKAVAAATGPARDTEVQLAWLEAQRDLVKSHERPGFQWLYGRLRERLRDEYDDIRAHLVRDFDRLAKRLEERLALPHAEDAEPWGRVAGALLREATGALADHLCRVHGEGDEAQVHQARIAGKRIRYLIEPLREHLPELRPAVKALKGLQDLMGEIHDIQVFSAELAEAAEEAGARRFRHLIDLSLAHGPDDPSLEGARRRDERAGLMTLARELHERRQDLFSRLLGIIGAGDAQALIGRLEAAADALQARCSPESEPDEIGSVS